MKDFELIKFSSTYDDPTFEIKRNKEYINFGKDNLAPDYMESLIDQSPVHNSLVTNIASMIMGEGFLDKTSEIFLNENGSENLDQILYKCAFDSKLYGAFALNIIWSKDQKSIAQIEHLDVSKIRIAAPDAGKVKGVPYYFVSPDWKNYRKDGNEPVIYQGFSKKYRKDASQIVYVKMEGKPNSPYALPSYWSAREYIEMQQLIISYHLNNIRYGSSVKTLVKINGAAPSIEEKQAFSNLWKKFRGEDGHRTAIIYDAEGIEIENLDEGFSDERFQSLDKLTTERIKQAHGVTGKGYVFGLANEQGTTFNSNRDQINEFTLMHNLRIRPLQLRIEQVFSNLFGEKFDIIPFRLTEEAPIDEDLDNLLPSINEDGTPAA